MASIGVTAKVIISSPLTRAVQTAEIVSQELGHEEKIVLDNALRPEATFEQFKALLNRHKDKACDHGCGARSQHDGVREQGTVRRSPA